MRAITFPDQDDNAGHFLKAVAALKGATARITYTEYNTDDTVTKDVEIISAWETSAERAMEYREVDRERNTISRRSDTINVSRVTSIQVY
jgi:hypothetical protein